MPQTAIVSDVHPLSEPARVLDTLIAPGKTFADIHRSASWWLPCVLVLLCSTLFSLAAIHKVGVARLSENLLATMPRMQDMIANAKPADAALLRAKFDKNITSQLYTTPLITLAASFAVAGCFLLTANFVFGGRATYKGMLAMYWYSILPLAVLSLLVVTLLAAGVNVETFRLTNPAGTNPGYYMPEGASPVLVAALSFFDIFSVWVFCLQSLGAAVVARIAVGKAFIAVGLWWVLYLVLKLLPPLLFS